MYPQWALGANSKGRVEFSKNRKNSPMPHFLHTMITVYSKDKMPNLSHKVFRSHSLLMYSQNKTPTTTDGNVLEKGSCNLLSNLFTNTLMWLHLVAGADPWPTWQTTTWVVAVMQAGTVTLIIRSWITNLPLMSNFSPICVPTHPFCPWEGPWQSTAAGICEAYSWVFFLTGDKYDLSRLFAFWECQDIIKIIGLHPWGALKNHSIPRESFQWT